MEKFTKPQKIDLPLRLFSYIGFKGVIRRKVKGKIGAVSMKEASFYLASQGISDVKLTDRTPFLATYGFGITKVSDYEIARIFEKIAIGVETGIQPYVMLTQALSEKFSFNSLLYIDKARKRLKEGNSLSESLSFDSIPDHIIKLIEIGEESGSLVESLTEIVKLLVAQADAKKEIKKATYKPLGLLSFALLILIFVVPMMLKPIEGIQKQFKTGQELPLITQIVMGITNFVVHYGVLVAAILGVLFYIHQKQYKKSFAWKEKVDKFLWNFPLVGAFQQALANFLFVLNFDLMSKSGVTQAQIIRDISEAQPNNVFKVDTSHIYSSLKEGSSLSSSLVKAAYLDSRFIERMKEGEETGKMAYQLKIARERAEIEFKERTAFLVKTMSFAFGFGITVFIGIIILACYAPMFYMINGVMQTL